MQLNEHKCAHGENRQEVGTRYGHIHRVEAIEHRQNARQHLRQNERERHKEQDLARHGQNNALRGLAGSLEVVRADDLEADDGQENEVHAQRERRQVDERRIGNAEESDDLHSEHHDEHPQHRADDCSAQHAHGKRLLHAMPQLRTVVEAQKRLHGD